MGNVPHSLVLDFSSLPKSTPQEMGFIYLSLVFSSGGGYVNWSGSTWHENGNLHKPKQKSSKKMLF
jgi:hypothetical protein